MIQYVLTTSMQPFLAIDQLMRFPFSSTSILTGIQGCSFVRGSSAACLPQLKILPEHSFGMLKVSLCASKDGEFGANPL